MFFTVSGSGYFIGGNRIVVHVISRFVSRFASDSLLLLSFPQHKATAGQQKTGH